MAQGTTDPFYANTNPSLGFRFRHSDSGKQAMRTAAITALAISTILVIASSLALASHCGAPLGGGIEGLVTHLRPDQLYLAFAGSATLLGLSLLALRAVNARLNPELSAKVRKHEQIMDYARSDFIIPCMADNSYWYANIEGQHVVYTQDDAGTFAYQAFVTLDAAQGAIHNLEGYTDAKDAYFNTNSYPDALLRATVDADRMATIEALRGECGDNTYFTITLTNVERDTVYFVVKQDSVTGYKTQQAAGENVRGLNRPQDLQLNDLYVQAQYPEIHASAPMLPNGYDVPARQLTFPLEGGRTLYALQQKGRPTIFSFTIAPIALNYTHTMLNSEVLRERGCFNLDTTLPDDACWSFASTTLPNTIGYIYHDNGSLIASDQRPDGKRIINEGMTRYPGVCDTAYFVTDEALQMLEAQQATLGRDTYVSTQNAYGHTFVLTDSDTLVYIHPDVPRTEQPPIPLATYRLLAASLSEGECGMFQGVRLKNTDGKFERVEDADVDVKEYTTLEAFQEVYGREIDANDEYARMENNEVYVDDSFVVDGHTFYPLHIDTEGQKETRIYFTEAAALDAADGEDSTTDRLIATCEDEARALAEKFDGLATPTVVMPHPFHEEDTHTINGAEGSATITHADAASTALLNAKDRFPNIDTILDNDERNAVFLTDTLVYDFENDVYIDLPDGAESPVETVNTPVELGRYVLDERQREIAIRGRLGEGCYTQALDPNGFYSLLTRDETHFFLTEEALTTHAETMDPTKLLSSTIFKVLPQNSNYEWHEVYVRDSIGRIYVALGGKISLVEEPPTGGNWGELECFPATFVEHLSDDRPDISAITADNAYVSFDEIEIKSQTFPRAYPLGFKLQGHDTQLLYFTSVAMRENYISTNLVPALPPPPPEVLLAGGSEALAADGDGGDGVDEASDDAA